MANMIRTITPTSWSFHDTELSLLDIFLKPLTSRKLAGWKPSYTRLKIATSDKFDNSPLILDHDFTHRRESQEPTASECAAKRWRISSPCPNYGATTDFDNLVRSQQMCVFVSILSGKWNEWSVVLIAILWHYLYSEFVFLIVSCARSCWVTCKDLWPPTHGALKCLLFQRAIISNQHYNFLSENWKLTK